MYKKIPTYNIDEKEWGHREFLTKEDYHQFVLSQYKLPGKYNLKYSNGWWNFQAKQFKLYRYYCNFVKNSRDYIKFWNNEREKCDIYGGVIFYHESEGLEYFVPGPYYFYLNYCLIYDKVKKEEIFPDIWDSDYHFFLHISLCLIEGLHSVVLKARQKGYSYKHAALLVLNTWFSKNQVNKIFAAKVDFVESTWNFISQYRNHLNTHTGWYRNFNPDKLLDWQQRVEIKDDEGKRYWKGKFNILKGFTTKDDAAKIVGGGNSFVYGEEAGINKVLHKTHEYLLPAVKLGHLVTGIVMYSGSVGELDDCGPLKDFFYKPVANGFRPVENIWDEEHKGTQCGFFVPEYWNYPECTDEWGNSDVEAAMVICHRLRKTAEQKGVEAFRLFMSQSPFTPAEAFAARTDSKFPLHLIEAEIMNIKSENKYGSVVELDYDVNGKIRHTIHTRNKPIVDFPTKHTVDNRGAIVIYDFPESGAQHGLYFAGVDPVRDLKTEYSSSLASCYIVKRSVEKNGYIEPEKVVASYTGRHDDPEQNHEVICKLIEFYNARALVENDVDTFIRYMMLQKKQKYLISKKEIALLHDLDLNIKTHAIYGITGTMAVGNRLLQNVIDYLKEEFNKIYNEETGEVAKIIRGVNYTRDIMLLTEMREWKVGLNVDRIKAFGYALMAARAHSTHYNYKEKTEEEMDYSKLNAEINKNITRTPFSDRSIIRSPFNKLR